MPATRTWTEEELMALPEDGLKRELVGGEIVVSPASQEHGDIIVHLSGLLSAFVRPRRLGWVFCSSTGLWMPSGNLRVPDITYLSRERQPGGPAKGFGRIPPDLTVEVLSPGDSDRAILDKVGEYLEAGVRMVWVIDPRVRKAVVHRSLTDVRELGEHDELDGEDVLPGFRCRLATLFE